MDGNSGEFINTQFNYLNSGIYFDEDIVTKKLIEKNSTLFHPEILSYLGIGQNSFTSELPNSFHNYMKKEEE